jgi:hypothetical protein
MQQNLELVLRRATTGLRKEVNHAKPRKENGLGRDGPPKVAGNHVKRGSKDDA